MDSYQLPIRLITTTPMLFNNNIVFREYKSYDIEHFNLNASFLYYNKSPKFFEEIQREVVAKFNRCGVDYVSVYCKDCEEHRYVPIVCGYRCCKNPNCVNSRYRRYKLRYWEAITKMRQVKKFELTLKRASHNLSFLKSFHTYCYNFIRRLKRYFKSVKFKFIAVIEIKQKSDGDYYYHLHCITDMPFIPQQKLSKMWYEVTGDSYVVWIQRVKKYSALQYVLKYLVKGVDVSIEDYAKYLYKKRLIFTSLDILKITQPSNVVNPLFRCKKCGSLDTQVGFYEHRKSFFYKFEDLPENSRQLFVS